MINNILLIFAAWIPSIVLCVYVYKKDKVEKESTDLLLKLFYLGMLMCIPAMFIEEWLSTGINRVFYWTFGNEITTFGYYLYEAVHNIVGVALVEEGLKFIVFLAVGVKSKEYNCLFDGIIYAVFVSLGFATFENVLYVTGYGWETAVLRAVVSVPGHMFFGVMMGYFYSVWRSCSMANKIGGILFRKRIVTKRGGKYNTAKYVAAVLGVPVFFHGAYDMCCSIDRIWAVIVWIMLVMFMYIYCFGQVRDMSKNDVELDEAAWNLTVEKNPQLKK